MTDDYTQAEIVRALQRLETGQARMESKFDSLTAGFVTREILDVTVAGLRQDIDDLKSSRAPWWTVAAVIISIAAVILPLVTR